MTQDKLFWNFVCKFQLPPSLVQVVRSFLSDSAWQFWFPFHTWVFGKIHVFPHWNVYYEKSLLILRRALGHKKRLWRRLWRSRCRGTLYFNVDTLVECAWNIRLRSFLGGVGVKSLMRRREGEKKITLDYRRFSSAAVLYACYKKQKVTSGNIFHHLQKSTGLTDQ